MALRDEPRVAPAEWVARYNFSLAKRNTFDAMVSVVDSTVANVTAALKADILSGRQPAATSGKRANGGRTALDLGTATLVKSGVTVEEIEQQWGKRVPRADELCEALSLPVMGVRDNGTETSTALRAEPGSAVATLRYYGEAILALLRVGMIGPICTLIDRERAF